MLPAIRNEVDPYSIPTYDINSTDVEGFIDELKGFHELFHDCFNRTEPRKNFYNYMVGQFSELERKSIEPIAINVEDGKVRSMQRTISDTPWDDAKMLSIYRSLVNEDIGHSDGVLIFDESGFLKKGDYSAGAGKQYCGSVGKTENCQVGVFCAYASPMGYSLVDKRLYIPQKWFTEEYDEKRKKCQIPDSIEFKSKPQLAADMFKEINNENQLPFKYVLADSIYGKSPDFIDVIEEFVGKIYFVSVSSDILCWLQQPITRIKEYQYNGKTKKKKVLEDTEKKPISLKTLASNINDYFWYKRKVSEGTKGPIEYEFTKREVVLAKDGLPWKKVWLIVKRTIEESPTYYYYISNAAVSTQLSIFVWLSGLRWAIEQCFEETKSELGMDQYEVRKFQGWHHHIMTCMLAHFFLWHLKIKLGKKKRLLLRFRSSGFY